MTNREKIIELREKGNIKNKFQEEKEIAMVYAMLGHALEKLPASINYQSQTK